MGKRFLKNPRPLLFALVAMVFLCMILLTLYFFARKENTLLKTARSEQFLALAADEAEAALQAWENDSPLAEVYHRITSAASYLTMAAPTEDNRIMAEKLRTVGKVLLQDGVLPDDITAILQTAAHGGESPKQPEIKKYAAEANGTLPALWTDMPAVSRKDGLKLAENMTQTTGILHPAQGKNLIYTCRNVYVKLSHSGGLPLEIAVYTPVHSVPSYPAEECAGRSSRFLERFLPPGLQVSAAAEREETDTHIRFLYPFRTGQVCVDVRTDTGRITGFQMLPEHEKEQSISGEKDCSYIRYSGSGNADGECRRIFAHKHDVYRIQRFLYC